MQWPVPVPCVDKPKLIHVDLHRALQGALAPTIDASEGRIPVVLDCIARSAWQCLQENFSKTLHSSIGLRCDLRGVMDYRHVNDAQERKVMLISAMHGSNAPKDSIVSAVQLCPANGYAGIDGLNRRYITARHFS